MIDRTVLIFTRLFSRTYLIIYRLSLQKHHNRLIEGHRILAQDISKYMIQKLESEVRIILQYVD
jgi:hypothetical protein